MVILSCLASAQEHRNTLWPPKGRQEEQFGAALDSDGRRMVVGALRVDAPGVLFVYRREGANWIEEARLSNRSVAEYDRFDGFGWTAEISGAHVAASARFDEGRVFVFEEDPPGVWTRTEIVNPDPARDQGFGAELELDGDTLVVSSEQRGSAYVFEKLGTDWVRTFDVRGLGVRDFRLEGDTLVLGVGGFDPGARVYERRGGLWTLAQRIPAAQASVIALDGERMALSSLETVLYERIGGVWGPTGSMRGSFDRLELDGERLVLRRSTRSLALGGYVIEIYEPDASGSWQLVRTLDHGLLEDPRESIYGQDFALHGSDLLVSSHDFNGTTLHSGVVLTYSNDARATLMASPQHASILTGDTLELALDAGVEHAGRPFILAGSLAGTSPGFSFGSHHIPLVRDRFYYPLSRQVGVLDGNGRASLHVNVPPLTPAFAHTTLHHAYVVFDPRRGLVHTSNVALTGLNYRSIP